MQRELYEINEIVVFRADATNNIGTGHLMRCLILADELLKHSYTSIFVVKDLHSDLIQYINTRGFQVILINGEDISIEQDATTTIEFVSGLINKPKWIIVDHYGIDYRWETMLRPHVKGIMVIDDLANRSHNCDILLDQNISHNYKLRYNKFITPDCKLFLGPEYLILKEHFYASRHDIQPRSGAVNQILVFFGGSDPTEETMKVLNCLNKNNYNDVEFNLIVGLSNKNKQVIERKTKQLKNVNFFCQVENISELILKADFALGAGGITMWERCFLGLPTAVTVVADNQQESVLVAEYHQTIWNMGWHENIISQDYNNIIDKALGLPNVLKRMSEYCLNLIPDSRLDYVINEIVNPIKAD